MACYFIRIVILYSITHYLGLFIYTVFKLFMIFFKNMNDISVIILYSITLYLFIFFFILILKYQYTILICIFIKL